MKTADQAHLALTQATLLAADIHPALQALDQAQAGWPTQTPMAGPAEPADTSEDSDRYHHRWIVSGHWRSQPYGPARAYRKPVWIAPHVKGPDGAPLLDGEKVRAVVR